MLRGGFQAVLDAVQRETKGSHDPRGTADALRQEKLLRVVATTADKYCGARPGDDETRTELLAPVLQRNDAVVETYRRRQPVTDATPDSGDVVGDPVQERKLATSPADAA